MYNQHILAVLDHPWNLSLTRTILHTHSFTERKQEYYFWRGTHLLLKTTLKSTDTWKLIQSSVWSLFMLTCQILVKSCQPACWGWESRTDFQLGLWPSALWNCLKLDTKGCQCSWGSNSCKTVSKLHIHSRTEACVWPQSVKLLCSLFLCVWFGLICSIKNECVYNEGVIHHITEDQGSQYGWHTQTLGMGASNTIALTSFPYLKVPGIGHLFVLFCFLFFIHIT